MKIDQEFNFSGQRYVCIGYRDYETMYGRWLSMLVLETDCPSCGIDFRLLATRTNARRRLLTRRCEDCRSPGVPVDPWRRKAAKAEPAPRRKSRRSKRPPAVRAAAPLIRAQRAPEQRAVVSPSIAPLAPIAALAVAPAPCPMSSAADIASRDAAAETYMRALGMLGTDDVAGVDALV
jgi:hypothetical protein